LGRRWTCPVTPFCVSRAGQTLAGPLELSFVGLAALGAQELLLGLALGWAASLVFSGAQLAGELIGQQMGFALANVVDPLLEQEVGIISFFKFTLAVVIFITLKLHLLVLEILGMSYEVVGLGQSVLRIELLEQVVLMFGRIWDAALTLGGPMLLVMLLLSVVIGFLTRTMPQLNIIVIGLPSRTMIGLLALAFAVRPFMLSFQVLCERMIVDVRILLESFSASG